MTDVNLLNRARLALRAGLGVTSGEGLLILSDATVGRSVREAFAAAGWALGAEPVEMSYTPVEYVSMREFGRFAAASRDGGPRLPSIAICALAAADAALILNSDMSIMFDGRLRELISQRSTRIAWAPYVSEDVLLRLLPESEAEFRALREATLGVADRLAGRHRVVVRSAEGAELQVEIGDHRVNCGTGVADADLGYGGLEIWPGGQVSTVPDLRSACGTLVIDRSVNAPHFARLSAPIELSVSHGRVCEILGGQESRELARWLASLDDVQAYNLTELGIGTNPRCRLAGVSAPCEDTHTRGCVSFALGADVHLGGRVEAPCHVDMTIHEASLEVDGRLLVDGGTLCV